MRIEGRKRYEAFAQKTLDEVVRIAEVFLVHLGSPALETLTYVSRARAPAPQSLVSKNSSTFPKISGALFDSSIALRSAAPPVTPRENQEANRLTYLSPPGISP